MPQVRCILLKGIVGCSHHQGEDGVALLADGGEVAALVAVDLVHVHGGAVDGALDLR